MKPTERTAMASKPASAPSPAAETKNNPHTSSRKGPASTPRMRRSGAAGAAVIGSSSQHRPRVDVVHRALVERGRAAFEPLGAVLQPDHVGAELGGELDVVDVAQHRHAQLARHFAD